MLATRDDTFICCYGVTTSAMIGILRNAKPGGSILIRSVITITFLAHYMQARHHLFNKHLSSRAVVMYIQLGIV